MSKIIFFFITFLCSAYVSSQIPERFRSMKKHTNSLYIPENEKSELKSNRSSFYYNDFSNPADWTMTNSSSPAYDWEIDTILPSSITSSTFADSKINSTSGGNFAFVNSFGQPFGSQQNCNLTNSVAIDCSSQTGVLLSFENYFMMANEVHTVMVSTDGVNFQNFEVNTGTNFTSDNSEINRVNISCVAANQTTVWIRFNYLGSKQFFWCVDDVNLIDISNYDLQIQNTYIHNVAYNYILGVPLDYYIVPNNLLEDIVIKSGMKNIGADTATNAFINGTVLNSSSVIIYNDSTTAVNFAPCDPSMEDSLIWTPPSIVGNYTIKTEAKFDSLNAETNLLDNVNELDFVINPYAQSGSTYARDNNIHTTRGLWNGSGNGYILGNVFDVKTDVTVYTIDVAFAPGTEPGVVGCVILYEIDPSTGDFVTLFDNCLDGFEYVIGSNHISTQSLTKWNKFCINPMGGFAGAQLVAGGTYIAAISHYGGTEDMVLQYGGESSFPFTSFLFDQTDATWYYITSKPKIRLGFEAVLYCVGAIDELSNPFQLQTYPNPSHDFTTISYTLNEALEINLEITDVTGKIIFNKNLGIQNAGENIYELDVSAFSNGIYFYSVSSSGSKSAQKLIVAHE
jgi:hypothetical protein